MNLYYSPHIFSQDYFPRNLRKRANYIISQWDWTICGSFEIMKTLLSAFQEGKLPTRRLFVQLVQLSIIE